MGFSGVNNSIQYRFMQFDYISIFRFLQLTSVNHFERFDLTLNLLYNIAQTQYLFLHRMKGRRKKQYKH